jgi:hypothetical protein
MSARDGEYLSLWWDDDYPPPEFVRGHVSAEVALASISRETGEPVAQLSGEYPYLAHIWARWELPNMHAESCGLDRILREYPTQERGCFKVTRLTHRGARA